MTMVTVDTRGFSCPVPLLMVQEEIKKSNPTELEVLTDAPCAVENIQRIAFLRTDGDGINDRGIRIVALQAPLVVVEMEHMGLLDAAVDQTDPGGITDIGF